MVGVFGSDWRARIGQLVSIQKLTCRLEVSAAMALSVRNAFFPCNAPRLAASTDSGQFPRGAADPVRRHAPRLQRWDLYWVPAPVAPRAVAETSQWHKTVRNGWSLFAAAGAEVHICASHGIPMFCSNLQNALLVACFNGHLEVSKYILGLGAAVSFWSMRCAGYCLLAEACSRGQANLDDAAYFFPGCCQWPERALGHRSP